MIFYIKQFYIVSLVMAFYFIIFSIHSAGCLQPEEMKSNDFHVFPRKINIVYLEDSKIFWRSMNQWVSQYNVAHPETDVYLSIYEFEDHFMDRYSEIDNLDAHFDLVLTDMQMRQPKSGFLVVDYLRKRNFTNPIIIVSSDHLNILEYHQTHDESSVYHEHNHLFSEVVEIRDKFKMDCFTEVMTRYFGDKGKLHIDSTDSNMGIETESEKFQDNSLSQKPQAPERRINDYNSLNTIRRFFAFINFFDPFRRTMHSIYSGLRLVHPDG